MAVFPCNRRRLVCTVATVLLLAAGVTSIAEEVVDANHVEGPGEPPAPGGADDLPPPSTDVTWSDDFNRPAGTDMGPDWTEYTGEMVIITDFGRSNLGAGWSYMLHNSASMEPDEAVMSIDVLEPRGVPGDHVGLIAGADPDLFYWYYTKIQDNNGDGRYNRIFFYSEGNGNGWGENWTLLLLTPFRSGRVTIYFTDNGDTLNVDIDTDFDGDIEQHYENAGAQSVYTIGTGFGIGAWGLGSYDNWEVRSTDDTTEPIPAISNRGVLFLTLLMLVSATFILRFRARRPGGHAS